MLSRDSIKVYVLTCSESTFLFIHRNDGESGRAADSPARIGGPDTRAGEPTPRERWTDPRIDEQARQIPMHSPRPAHHRQRIAQETEGSGNIRRTPDPTKSSRPAKIQDLLEISEVIQDLRHACELYYIISAWFVGGWGGV